MSKPVIFFHEEADHSGFLFNSDNCSSIQLNPTAVAIYKLLKQGVIPEDVPSHLAGVCSSPLPENAAEQIAGFISQLKEKNWL